MKSSPQKSPRHTYRIGACSWSMAAQGPDALTLAKAIGLDGVEMDAGQAVDTLVFSSPDAQAALRQRTSETGVAVTSICPGFFNYYPIATDSRAEAWISQCIDAAASTGGDIVLLPFFDKGNLRTEDNMLKSTDIAEVIQRLKRASTKAEKAGITLGIENTLSAAQQMDILDRIGSPAVAIYYDIGNASYFGYDPATEIRQLGKRMCRIHFKDRAYLGEAPCIDLSKVVAALRDIDYQGWLMLETSCPSGNPEADFKRNLATLRQAFAA